MDRPKLFARAQVIVASTAILVGAAACGTWNVQSVRLNSSAYPSRPEGYAIELLTGAVDRPHVELAQISVSEKPAHMPSIDQFSADAAAEQLRIRARELGADAVKDVKFQTGAPGTVGAGSIAVTGTAIRWK
jgi:hypothetical protein